VEKCNPRPVACIRLSKDLPVSAVLVYYKGKPKKTNNFKVFGSYNKRRFFTASRFYSAMNGVI